MNSTIIKNSTTVTFRLVTLDGGKMSMFELGAFLTLKEFPLTFLVKSPVGSISILVPIELPQHTIDRKGTCQP